MSCSKCRVRSKGREIVWPLKHRAVLQVQAPLACRFLGRQQLGLRAQTSTALQPIAPAFCRVRPTCRFSFPPRCSSGRSHSVQHLPPTLPSPVQEHQCSSIHEHGPFRIRPFSDTSCWAQTNNLTMHFQEPHCNLSAAWAASLCIRLQPDWYRGDLGMEKPTHPPPLYQKVEAI